METARSRGNSEFSKQMMETIQELRKQVERLETQNNQLIQQLEKLRDECAPAPPSSPTKSE